MSQKSMQGEDQETHSEDSSGESSFLSQTFDLKSLRKLSGLTQREIATRMGINQSQVSKIEKIKDLKISTLYSYVRALHGYLQIIAIIDGKEISTISRQINQ